MVTDATLSLGESLQKAIKTRSREAGHLKRYVSEFVDAEDILKSVHKLSNPENYENPRPNIIHTPVNWSKNTFSSWKMSTRECFAIPEEDEDGENNQKKNCRKLSNV